MDASGINTLDEQCELLTSAVHEWTGIAVRLSSADLLQPNRLRDSLTSALGVDAVVTGGAERRLVMLGAAGSWNVVDLGGVPLGKNIWPTWFNAGVTFETPSLPTSEASVSGAVLDRIRKPRVLLCSLYRPDIFPLPRFALAVSDLARAARVELCGHVTMRDMQLGATVQSVVEAVGSGSYDLVGVSATFGQHDLQTAMLEAMLALQNAPLVVAGGSLTVRNERDLLARFPELLIARGAGEDTIQDLLGYLRGDIERDAVRGLGYAKVAPEAGSTTFQIGRSGVVPNRSRNDFLPELDLLAETVTNHGVAQLELSRGCTHSCSFCPRSHKGMWSGEVTSTASWTIQSIGQVLSSLPASVRRTLYIVDEEFIGRGPDSAQRALDLASVVKDAGMTWETSCRADQVVRVEEGREWHVERAEMWRKLLDLGLERCLFGIESGVTSILERFHKETTGRQNALAVRMLSGMAVPTRYAYITFDPLMTFEELRQTIAFQARTDLVLRPFSGPIEELVDGVRDEEFVAANSMNTPFYRGIPYLMVTMECLTGSAYTRKAKSAGLTGRAEHAMGRVVCRFADWRIQAMSLHSQLWVDRNFALDYTLKSIEKLTSGSQYAAVRVLRTLLKDSSFTLLNKMFAKSADFTEEVHEEDALNGQLLALMEAERTQVLIPAVSADLEQTMRSLPFDCGRILADQVSKWLAQTGWQLIND